MSELDDDIARGYLENGEPLEAKWGTGWWSNYDEQQPEPEWGGGECPFCHKEALYCNLDFHLCEHCGKTYKDLGGDSEQF